MASGICAQFGRLAPANSQAIAAGIKRQHAVAEEAPSDAVAAGRAANDEC